MRMQMKWRWSVLAVLAIVMLAGCNKGLESQLVGKWKADTSSLTPPATPGNDPQQAKMMAEMMKGMMGNMSIDFKADKTFAMNMMMVFSGTWAVDESAKTVALTMTKMGDVDMTKMPNAQANNKPMILQFDPASSRLTMQDAGGKAGPMGRMAFTKE